MTELRACPFCGKPPAPIEEYKSARPQSWWVECETRGCWSSGPHRKTEDQAIKAWNGLEIAELSKSATESGGGESK